VTGILSYVKLTAVAGAAAGELPRERHRDDQEAAIFPAGPAQSFPHWPQIRGGEIAVLFALTLVVLLLRRFSLPS